MNEWLDVYTLHFLKFLSQNDHGECPGLFQLGVQIALYAEPVYSNSETLYVLWSFCRHMRPWGQEHW
jgi:hypothetical protein